MNEEAVGTGTQQSLMDELRNSIGIVYEKAISLDREVVDRQEKYFGLNDTNEKAGAVPDNMAGEMFALLYRTIEMLDRAHKYVLAV